MKEEQLPSDYYDHGAFGMLDNPIYDKKDESELGDEFVIGSSPAKIWKDENLD